MGSPAEHMPLTALIRNLATLTRVGTIAPMKSAWVCERLNAIGNARTEDFTRIHPIAVLTTSELSLHRCPAVKARRMATPKDTRHSTHGPGSEKGGEEQQTAGKTTAGQRARPVHQMPARTRQAKQGPL